MMLLQNFDGCQQQAICDSSVDLSNKAKLQFIKLNFYICQPMLKLIDIFKIITFKMYNCKHVKDDTL